MNLRKLMVVLCSLMLVFMVACSSNGGESTQGNNDVVQNTENPTPEPSESTDEGDAGEPEATVNPNVTPEMDFDMGGRTIKWVSWYE